MKHVMSLVAASMLIAGHAAADETGADAAEKSAVAAVKGDIVIENPIIIVRGGEIVAHMVVHNSGEADAITGVASDAAQEGRFVRVTRADGEKTVEDVEVIPVEGESALMLDGDGYHVVLGALDEEAQQNGVTSMTVTFEDEGDIELQVSVAVLN